MLFSKKPFMFTMWDDLADNEGAELLQQLHDHPVILAKRVAVTEYRRGMINRSSYLNICTVPPLYFPRTLTNNFSALLPTIFMPAVLRLTTRYASTILINPPYVQATESMHWCDFDILAWKLSIWKRSVIFTVAFCRSKENERMLAAYT